MSPRKKKIMWQFGEVQKTVQGNQLSSNVAQHKR